MKTSDRAASDVSVWQWPTGPSTVAPRADEVHVWRAVLDLPGSHVQRLRAVFSGDERARAERFAFATHRDRFVAARATLRAVLARYLAVRPERPGFVYGPRGKPALAPLYAPSALTFNLARSGGLALYAVARGRQVGVDLEQIRPELADDGVAARVFSPSA